VLAGVASTLAPWREVEGAPLREPPWTFSGGLWAAALLVRVENVLALPFVFLDAWWRGGRRGLVRVAAPVAVVIGLWTAVNARFSHELVLATPGAGSICGWATTHIVTRSTRSSSGRSRQVETEMRSRATNAVEWDRLVRRQAFSFLYAEPGRALGLLWKKFVWTWVDRELPNTSDIEWQTAQSWSTGAPSSRSALD